jgi:hypothetical protein
MLALRFYIDRKIDAKTGEGGEHVCVIDVADIGEDKARALVVKKLRKDEEIGSVASITIDDPESHPVLS